MCTVVIIDPKDTDSNVANFLMSYGFYFCGGFLTTLCSYVLSIRRIRGIRASFDDSENPRTNRLLLYPIVLLIAILPPFIDELVIIGRGTPLTGAMMFSVIFNHSIGLMNTVVYGYIRRLHKTTPNSTNKELQEYANNNDLSLNWDSVKKSFE